MTFQKWAKGKLIGKPGTHGYMMAEAAWDAAIAAEREACAKVCEEDAFVEQWYGLAEAVKRVRARSNTP